jgi:hypothetical protein
MLVLAASTGAIGLGLFALGLGGSVLAGALGARSASGIQAIAAGLGGMLLMFPSAVALGVGFLFLRIPLAGVRVRFLDRPPRPVGKDAEPPNGQSDLNKHDSVHPA